MRVDWTFISSLSVLIPIVTGLVRFGHIGRKYRPLFILLLAGLATELISYYERHFQHPPSNVVVSNVYALLEWLLVFWLFGTWAFFRGRKALALAILVLPCLVWLAENIYPGHMSDLSFSPYYRIFYSFLIVLFSINQINFMITHDNRNLLSRPEFLICIAFIIYFIYDIVYEWAFNQARHAGETSITTTIISLFDYINALTNIIFAIAFLKIPTFRKFELW